jgi:hypothetical protein
MKKVELKSRKLLRNIFGGISLTAMVFIFQACYGTGPDRYSDVKLTGKVVSKTSNLPINGIKITVNEGYNYGFTDENGKFDFYVSVPDWAYEKDGVNYIPGELNVHFLDIDGVENGHFADTTIIIKPAYKNEVKIDVELREIQ